MRLRSSLTFSKKRRGIRYAHNTLLSYFNIHTLYLHKRLSLKLSLAFYSEWLTSKHTENNWVLILRHTGLLLTCETGALWSGVLGNQMWVKCCLIKIIFYRYLNLKAEIRVCCLHLFLWVSLLSFYDFMTTITGFDYINLFFLFLFQSQGLVLTWTGSR